MTIQPIQSTKRGPMRPPVLITTIIETTLRVGSNVTITLFGLNCLHLGVIVHRTGFFCLDEGAQPLCCTPRQKTTPLPVSRAGCHRSAP